MLNPTCRPAYALPATHFAATGDRDPESPWMGMRVRLNASFDCRTLRPLARVFCATLKTRGGIFADNGEAGGPQASKWGGEDQWVWKMMHAE